MANTTGKKFGGRVAGTPNKLSATVKDNVISVFNDIGGTEHMKTWAMDNPNQFYNIYAKLLPIDITGELDHNLKISKIEIEIVDSQTAST
jgi:hypothetical protein